MLGRIALGLFTLFLMFAFGSSINSGIVNLRTDEVTNVASVVTGGGVTTGDVTLSRDLFGAELSHITSVVSADPTDVPIAFSYVEATKVLTISGLQASTTRDITVVYKAEKSDVFWGAVGPFLGFLVFGGIIAAIIYSIWKPSRR